MNGQRDNGRGMTIARRFELLEMQIAAWAAEALCFLYFEAENQELFDHYRAEAWRIAESIGFRFSELDGPPSGLHEGSELVDAFHVGQGQREEEEYETRKEAERLARAEKLASVLRGEAKWDTLSLPSPEELLKELLETSVAGVDGYRLWFEDEVTWFTNPYGQDGALGNEPDLEMLTDFLAGLAEGRDYGPVPH